MKYSLEKFNSCVDYYKNALQKHKDANVLIIFDNNNKKAFFSIAPLSRALHELGCDLNAMGFEEDKSSLEVLKEVWKTFNELKNNIDNEKTEALKNFIEKTKEKVKDFESIFKEPDLILKADDEGFKGSINLDFKDTWLKEYRTQELDETAKILWKEVYNIKDTEKVGIGFELIAMEEMLGHPLEDYLDSYQIIWSMSSKCNGKVSLNASTPRDSMLKPMEAVSDLKATLLGCELEKEIDEEPFRTYKLLSEKLDLARLKPIDASFAVSGKGYPGKHLFGDSIGYPSPNKKTRWKSPGQLIYKLDFYPQTKFDGRDPMARVAFTETLPIDIFIETNLVDWNDIRARNQKIKDVMDKCDKIIVKSNIEERYKTNLEVALVKPDGKRRWVRRSDTDVREKINQEYLEMTGIKAGCMGNIPGGEAFVTPESITGTFVGDVVIAIDQSYSLGEKDPFVVECKDGFYKILSAPKAILKKFNERKKEAWQMLEEAEKNKSLSEDIIKMKKKNFERVGEFAINTNPKAKLCSYLIVNEKIAKMMHIALGSGYEEDRSTDYHIDIVFDAPRQKLDVYGIDKSDKEHKILEKGEFVV